MVPLIQRYVKVVICSTHHTDFFVKNPMNWSPFKKTWVMGQVCLLTFSVYFGSAIYTAGIVDVARQFGVSTVASTLGVTFFLLGAGTGWSF
jgi:DHA1 family multidrug resistance protein-like MFS transporter